MTPHVTALIDTYNHERFIAQAVESVLAQEIGAREMEVLVVDDGSTDGTAAVVQKFAPRVRCLRKPNGGQASAFNAGIAEARGEIVAFLDGDDWWARGKLAAVLDALEKAPEVGIVGHGIVEVYPDGRKREETLLEGHRFRVDSTYGARTFRLRKSLLGTSRMTLRRSLLQRILPVPEALVFEADEYVFTMAAVLGDVQILEPALTYYRLHADNFYLISGADPAKVRRKQKIFQELAAGLTQAMQREKVAAEVVAEIIEVLHVEATLLRLQTEGGFPWETVWTEMKIHQIHCTDAGAPQRLWRFLTLLPAWLLPPRVFYRARGRLAGNPQYAWLRRNLVPFAGARHVRRRWGTD